MPPEERATLVAELFKSAVELPPCERMAFIDQHCRSHPGLKGELDSLFRAREHAERFMERSALDVAADNFFDGDVLAAGEVVGDYEIVSLIGRGGMGEVYLACDRQLKRNVALKLIRRGMDTGNILRRFQHEQRLLAGLNHPNIAQLHGVGLTNDGLPFFVMEYIEGTRLDDYCVAKAGRLRERLEVFAKICGAVHYAHQHLVVHRDLKPSNILVTADGEPKLLDFGVAKALDADTNGSSALTLTLQGAMTPEYASPEQVRGDQMTTASDIYSLGVLLYELLTGAKPYEILSRTPVEIARVISENEPRRPSTALAKGGANSPGQVRNARYLKGDLDNIVLMAMRKEPERRYSSAAQLAADIRRHLEGLPVTARRDTLRYRSFKFVRRHRVAVGAATLLVAAIVAGLITTMLQARRAEKQRARAEARFNDLRALANALVLEIIPKMVNVPGTSEAREIATKRAFEYLDRLAREGGEDITLQQELAVAYRAMADAVAMGKGDYGQARESRLKALAIQERILRVQPDNPAVRDQTARDLQGEAWSRWISGDIAGALRAYEKSFVLREALLASEPRNFDYVYRLAHVHLTRGELFLSLDKPAEARQLFLRALSLFESLSDHSDASRQVVRLQRGVLWSHNCVGDSFVMEEEWDRAMQEFKTAEAFAEPMYVSTPNEVNALENICRSYVGQARVYLARADYAAAETKLLRCLEIREANPQTDAYERSPVAELSSELGAVYLLRGNIPRAAEQLEKARRMQEELALAAPQNSIFLKQLATTHERLASVEKKRGHLETARESLEKSLLLREQIAIDSANTGAQKDLALACDATGSLHMEAAAAPGLSEDERAAHLRSACAYYERSRSLLRALCEMNPPGDRWRTALADVTRRLLECSHAPASP